MSANEKEYTTKKVIIGILDLWEHRLEISIKQHKGMLGLLNQFEKEVHAKTIQEFMEKAVKREDNSESCITMDTLYELEEIQKELLEAKK